MRTIRECSARIDELTTMVLKLESEIAQLRDENYKLREAARWTETQRVDRAALLARARALTLQGKKCLVRGDQLFVQ